MLGKIPSCSVTFKFCQIFAFSLGKDVVLNFDHRLMTILCQNKSYIGHTTGGNGMVILGTKWGAAYPNLTLQLHTIPCHCGYSI